MYQPHLTKEIRRITTATRFSKGKRRSIIVSLLPPATIGFRLQGERQTLLLDPEIGWEVALRLWMKEVDNLAKKIKKEQGGSLAKAIAKAKKQLS